MGCLLGVAERGDVCSRFVSSWGWNGRRLGRGFRGGVFGGGLSGVFVVPDRGKLVEFLVVEVHSLFVVDVEIDLVEE